MKGVTKGSGNVFADLGFEDAEEMQLRAHLTQQIYSIIKQRELTQSKAAEILGLAQPDVSALMNGKFVSFSVDRLLKLLVRLNQDIEIVVRPAPKSRASGRVSVSRKAKAIAA
jgi:predicted XRE-type DNA-binding protein